jgi:DNA-binding LacI/PurR family transcriptional regulator
MVVKSIESSCRKRKLLYDFQELHFLMDPEKLAEKYCGIILFGAAIEGNEPFMHTIRQSGLPVIYCREDDNNTITESIASVGVDMKKAYLAGLDYLILLGFRRIMLSTSDDERTCQRLGFSHQDLVRILNERNLPDASEMICSFSLRNTESIKEKIKQLDPEAIFCYSDSDALVMYNILSELGKKIPQDVAVLGFGYGSDLVKPTLSSVSLVSPLFGEAVISLLEKLLKNPGMKPPQLDLPFGIFCGESTGKMNLNNLIEKY